MLDDDYRVREALTVYWLRRGAWVCACHMSYLSAIRPSPAHCRHHGAQQFSFLRRAIVQFPPRSIRRKTQLDQCAKLTKKRVKSGMTNAFKRETPPCGGAIEINDRAGSRQTRLMSLTDAEGAAERYSWIGEPSLENL